MPLEAPPLVASAPASTGLWPAAIAIGIPGVLVFPSLLVGALVTPISRDLGMDAMELGIALSLYNASAAATANFYGTWIDYQGARVGLAVGGLIVAFSSGAIALVAHNWTALCFLLCASGAGVSFAHLSANRLLSIAIRKDRRGLAFGLKQSVLPAAAALAGLSVGLVQWGVEWRTLFLMVAMIVLCLAVASLTVRDTARPQGSSLSGRLLQMKSLMLLSLSGTLSAGAATAFTGFIVFSGITRGLTESHAGMVLAASSMVSVAVRLTVGWITDRSSKSLMLRMAKILALGGAGCIGVAFAPNDISFVLFAIVMGGAGWGIAGLFHYSVVKLQPDLPAKASGIAMSGLFIGSAIGPFLFGALAQYATMEAAWMAMAISIFVSVGLVVCARHSYRHA